MSESDYPFSQKVVVLGGGTGQFNLLQALVDINKPDLITAIPGTWDSGGSSGKLRTELGILPPGDARQCLVALMETEDQLREALWLSEDRFKNVIGPLHGHDLLNLIIEQLSKIHQGQDRGIDAFRKLFRIRGQVNPASLTPINITAKLFNGEEVEGEAALDERWKQPGFDPSDPGQRIDYVYIDNRPDPNPKALEAIRNADKIILSSGSLWGSVVPHTLIVEERQAILESKAPLFMVLNLMTEPGQTDGFKASDHLRPLVDALGSNRINYLLANKNGISQETLDKYLRENQQPVSVDIPECKILVPNIRVITEPYVLEVPEQRILRHHPKLAHTILELD